MPLDIKLNDTNKGYELQIIQTVLIPRYISKSIWGRY